LLPYNELALHLFTILLPTIIDNYTFGGYNAAKPGSAAPRGWMRIVAQPPRQAQAAGQMFYKEAAMSGLIVFFFVYTTLTVLVSAVLLPRYLHTARANRFSIGLGLIAAAFAVWSYAVVTKPDPGTLQLLVFIGLLGVLAALMFFISAATLDLSQQQQMIALGAGAGFAILLIIVRFFYPSNPYFSPNGYFYFGQQPIVKLMTIFLLAATIIPVAFTLARDIRQKSALAANAMIAACMTELVGAILLLSNTEDDFLFLVGWVMGAAFLLLVLIAAGVVERLSPAPGTR
jgi:hypothetical protein